MFIITIRPQKSFCKDANPSLHQLFAKMAYMILLMASHGVLCNLIAYLISKHKYGFPVKKDVVINRSGVRSDKLGEAKDAFDELRKDAPFIQDHGDRGIQIDNDSFGLLADYLYVHCNWEAEKIHSRLKHYEGWSQHQWSPPK